MATIGEALLAPETGWKRINPSDTRIKFLDYFNEWASKTVSSAYTKKCLYVNSNKSQKIYFKFTGTKLRIVGLLSDTVDYSKFTIVLDGEFTPIHLVNPISGELADCLFFEKLDLTDGEHIVQIEQTTGVGMNITGIDVDSTKDLAVYPTYYTYSNALVSGPATGYKSIITYEKIEYSCDDAVLTGTNGLRPTRDDTLRLNSKFLAILPGRSISFSFKSNNLILINPSAVANTICRHKISIDGNDIYAYCYASISNKYTIYQNQYPLSDDIHTVVITNTDSTNIAYIYRIDIDQDGEILEPNITINNSSNTLKKIEEFDIDSITLSSRFQVSSTPTTIAASQSYLFNNNEIGIWQSINTESGIPYLIIKFKEPTILDNTLGFRLYDKLTSGASYLYSYCNIYGSNDNVTFEKIHEVDSNIMKGLALYIPATSVTFNFSNSTAYLYYKIEIGTLNTYTVLQQIYLYKHYELDEPTNNIVDITNHDYTVYAPFTELTNTINYTESKYTATLYNKIAINFYGTSIKLIGTLYKKLAGRIEILIDGTVYGYLNTRGSDTRALNTILASITGLTQGEHQLLLTHSDIICPNAYFGISKVILDSDGYLIEPVLHNRSYGAIKGFKRYNLSPTENSLELRGTSGSIYTVADTGSYGGEYLAVKYSSSIVFSFKGTEFMLIVYASAANSYYMASNCIINIDGISYPFNASTLKSNGEISSLLVFKSDILTDNIHNIIITNNTSNDYSRLGLDAIDIKGYGMINTHFCIKQNDKYYSYDKANYNTTTKMYNEITPDADLNSCPLALSDLVTSVTLNGETFKPIDKFNNFKILSNRNINVKAYPSTALITANNDFSTTVVNNIDYFSLLGVSEGSTSIFIIVSADKGLTWKTYKSDAWVDIAVNIPLKDYSEMTLEEINQIKASIATIKTNGINISTLQNVDFNKLNSVRLRFAYVLARSSTAYSANIQTLSWKFDSVGRDVQLNYADIQLLDNRLVLVPSKDMDMIKLNVTLEKNV